MQKQRISSSEKEGETVSFSEDGGMKILTLYDHGDFILSHIVHIERFTKKKRFLVENFFYEQWGNEDSYRIVSNKHILRNGINI